MDGINAVRSKVIQTSVITFASQLYSMHRKEGKRSNLSWIYENTLIAVCNVLGQGMYENEVIIPFKT